MILVYDVFQQLNTPYSQSFIELIITYDLSDLLVDNREELWNKKTASIETLWNFFVLEQRLFTALRSLSILTQLIG